MAALAVFAIPVAHAQPSAPSGPPILPGLGVRLLEVPENLADDPRAQIYVIDNVPPGTTIMRQIEITNRTSAAQSVDIYPGAAHIEDVGGFAVEDGAAMNELSSWMSVDRRKLEMATGQIEPVTLTIAVPKDAPEGEQYAVMWAQITGPDPAGSGTRLVNRVGIRVYLSVGPGNGPAANFRIDSLTPRRSDVGASEVVAAVTNTGGRAVDLGGQLTLTEGPGGLSLGPRDATVLTLAPGNEGEVVFSLNADFPAGPWKAFVSLRSGLLHKEATATLTFPSSGVGDSVTITEPTTDKPWIWIIGTGIAVALAAILAVLLLMRRRSRRST